MGHPAGVAHGHWQQNHVAFLALATRSLTLEDGISHELCGLLVCSALSASLSQSLSLVAVKWDAPRSHPPAVGNISLFPSLRMNPTSVAGIKSSSWLTLFSFRLVQQTHPLH